MINLFDPTKSHLRTWISIHDVDDYSFDDVDIRLPTLALYYAALCGFDGLSRQLIITHALDVDGRARFENAPLHAASRRGHVKVAQALLDYGADINAPDNHKQTPLYLARCYEHIEFMRFLLKNGANPNILPVHFSSFLWLSSENLELARLLLDCGADVNFRDKDGLTPFQRATHAGHHDIAQLLLDRGAERE